ncbi:MAG: hypothetical protein IT542_10450 [Rubellimicrobium sp.]|nr:hypothetical protein [Rubellimicrobium sp.]
MKATTRRGTGPSAAAVQAAREEERAIRFRETLALTRELEESHGQIATLAAEARAADERRAGLERELEQARAEAKAARKDAQTARKKAKSADEALAASRAEAARHAARVAELVASTSWRITAPLRRVVLLLRR